MASEQFPNRQLRTNGNQAFVLWAWTFPFLASGLSLDVSLYGPLRTFRTMGSSSAAPANRRRRQLEAQEGGQRP
jgi:hypothetical protein